MEYQDGSRVYAAETMSKEHVDFDGEKQESNPDDELDFEVVEVSALNTLKNA